MSYSSQNQMASRGVKLPKQNTFALPDSSEPGDVGNGKAQKKYAHRADFGAVVSSAVQYAHDNIEYANNTKQKLFDLIKQCDSLLLANKEEQLARSLQNAYNENAGDIGKCNEAWNSIIEMAKNDPDFTRLRDATSIEHYADNVIQPYRVHALTLAQRRADSDYRKVSELHFKKLQNDFSIAYGMMADEDVSAKENGFLLYAEAVHGIGELYERKFSDGSPVFSEADKIIHNMQNGDLFAQCYARTSYKKKQTFLEKLDLIEGIERGTISVAAKDFFAIPDKLLKGKDISDLGVFSFADVSRDMREGITRELRSELKEEKRLEEKAIKNNLAKGVLNGSVVPMPSSYLYKQSVKDYYSGEFFQNLMKLLDTPNVEAKREKALQMHRDFINKLQFVPSEMLDFCTDAMVNPDPSRVVLGCDLANLIVSEFPHARVEDPQALKTSSLLLYGSRLLKNGTPPSVVAGMLDNLRKIDDVTKKQRKEDFANKVANNDLDFGKIIDKVWVTGNDELSFGNKLKEAWNNKRKWSDIFESESDAIKNTPLFVRQRMTDDYRSFLQGAYLETGDWETSEKVTRMQMLQKWGKTKINGRPEWTVFPIETFWESNEFPAEQVIRNVHERLQREFFAKNGIYRSELPKYTISFDERTIREVMSGGIPSYRVYFEDEYGVLHDNFFGQEKRLTLFDVLPKGIAEQHPLAIASKALSSNALEDELANRSLTVKYIKNNVENYRYIKNREKQRQKEKEADEKKE